MGHLSSPQVIKTLSQLDVSQPPSWLQMPDPAAFLTAPGHRVPQPGSDGAGRARAGERAAVSQQPPGGCRVGGEASPGFSPISYPHPAPSGVSGHGVSSEGQRKPNSLGLPIWGRGEEEVGGKEPAGSAVCSAHINRLLWLSPLLFRPLCQTHQAAVGSAGRRSPLGHQHGSRQLAPSSALKWPCKKQNALPMCLENRGMANPLV